MSSMAACYAMKKKKKMAEGGDTIAGKIGTWIDTKVSGPQKPPPRPLPTGQNTKGAKILGDSFNRTFAEGGEADEGYKGEPLPNILNKKWRYEHGKEHDSPQRGVNRQHGNDKEKHGKTLKELKDMPKPKLKGLAKGGFIEEENMSGYVDHDSGSPEHNSAATHEDDRLLGQHGEDEIGPEDHMAEGGFIGSHQSSEDLEHDLVARIIKQRMYSKGGMIANGGEDELSHMADSRPNNFDDLSLRDHLESSYTGANSGDHLGNAALDKEDHDLVARIMRSRAKKDKLPNPR